MSNVERKKDMKTKLYIQPVFEVMAVNATYNLCAQSTFEKFGIGDPISAEQGR